MEINSRLFEISAYIYINKLLIAYILVFYKYYLIENKF